MKYLLFTLLITLSLKPAYSQVKATSAELNTGTDDDKFATALALQGSKYLDQSGAKLFAVTAAGANTYTATITPAITVYGAGQLFYIKITTANTAAATLNLNGLGAKALVKDAATPLVAGDLLANKIYGVYYDGTNFQVMNTATAASNFNISGDGTIGGKLTLNGISNRIWNPASTTYGLRSFYDVNSYVNPIGSVSGDIRIDLPIIGSTMWCAKITLYEHDAVNTSAVKVTDLVITGYATTNTNRSVYSTNANRIAQVRFGRNTASDKTVLLIKSNTGTFAYPKVVIKEFTVSHVGQTSTNFENPVNYPISLSTDDTDFTLTGTILNAGFLRDAGYILNQTTPQAGTNFNVSGNGTVGGVLAVGGAVAPNVGVYNRYNLTGGTIAYGNLIQTTIQNTVTSAANIYYSLPSTAASPFNLAQLVHFTAGQGTIGAESSINTQIGFSAGSTLTGAAKNYGFYSALPAGTDRYSFYSAGTAQSYLSGNLGLNVLVPTEKLDVAGNVKITNANATKLKLQQSAATQANFIDFLNETGTSIGLVGKGASANNDVYLGSRTANVVLMAENVVRSTISATGLTVSGTVTATGGNSTNWNTAFGWGNHAGLYSTIAATQTAINTADATAVHKTGNETITGIKLFSTNVGIGTTNTQGYKLAVGGSMIAESVKVKLQTAWPDYVFEKDYPMLSLTELEQFVLKNKHLPAMPTTEEVKKEGIELGAMNAKLLQKIEELTLYVIDLKKENEVLKNDNAEQIKDLSKRIEQLSNDMKLLKNK